MFLYGITGCACQMTALGHFRDYFAKLIEIRFTAHLNTRLISLVF